MHIYYYLFNESCTNLARTQSIFVNSVYFSCLIRIDSFLSGKHFYSEIIPSQQSLLGSEMFILGQSVLLQFCVSGLFYRLLFRETILRQELVFRFWKGSFLANQFCFREGSYSMITIYRETIRRRITTRSRDFLLTNQSYFRNNAFLCISQKQNHPLPRFTVRSRKKLIPGQLVLPQKRYIPLHLTFMYIGKPFLVTNHYSFQKRSLSSQSDLLQKRFILRRLTYMRKPFNTTIHDSFQSAYQFCRQTIPC